MSFNIVDLVKSQISDQLVGQMSSILGSDKSQTTGALAGALPGLLSGLAQSSNNPGGAGALFDAVDKQDGGMLGNIGNLLGNDQSGDVAKQGSSMLTSLLGGSAVSQLAGVVANLAGLNRGSSSSLLGILAPIIIGVLKNKVMDGGMKASSLSSMFNDQSANINAAMPQGFSEQLKSAGFFDSIAAAPMAATSTPDTPKAAPAHVAAEPAKSGGGLMKWLLPLAAVVVLGWFGMQYMGKKAETDAQNVAAAAAEKVAAEAADAAKVSSDALSAAQDAMPDGIDLSKISNQFDGVFGSTSEALSGITDVESAKAALPSLQDAGSKLGGLSDVVTRLPDAAKGPISGIITAGIAALQPIIDKASAIPGVGALIDPVIKPMMETLSGLAG